MDSWFLFSLFLKTIFKNSSQFTTNLRGRYRDFPMYPLTPYMRGLSHKHPCQSRTFVIIRFYLMGYNLLLCIYSDLQIIPDLVSRAPSIWLLWLLTTPHHFLNTSSLSDAIKYYRFILYVFISQPWNQLFLQRSHVSSG